MIVKPPVPEDIRRPRTPGFPDRIRQRCVRLAHALADRGLYGTSVTKSVIICGFPRSGTTLLHLMLQTGYPTSRRFPRERPGLVLAKHEWPARHSLLISKRPNDVFWIDEIRDAYRARATRPRFIVTTRDPRAILTSKHKGRSGYYVSVDRWRGTFSHIRYAREASDVTVLDYGELVRDPKDVEQRLVEAVGEPPTAPLDSFSTAVPEGFNTAALNGVRPIDTASLDKWREPQHAERIRQILVEAPELMSVLVEEGYEPDGRWADGYR